MSLERNESSLKFGNNTAIVTNKTRVSEIIATIWARGKKIERKMPDGRKRKIRQPEFNTSS